MGVVSAGLERRYPGLAIQAVILTVAVCACLLLAYGTGLIRITESFNRKLAVATGGIVLYYAVSFLLVMSGFHGAAAPAVGMPGILFSIIIVIIAGLNLISDFDSVLRYSSSNLPKYMEWYAAFGLVLTLLWLYIEMVRLLTKVRRAEAEA